MFFRWVVYPLGKALLFVLLALLGPVRVRGRRNVPRRGGLLILSNHLSDVDPPVVGYVVPRPVHFMAKSELFEIRVLKHIVRFFRGFPVKRGSPDRGAIRRAVALLQAGEAVVMFPEGEGSESGKLLPVLPGAALIVRQAGVPVICLGLRGTNRIMPYGKLIPRPALGGVVASFGEPRTFDHGTPQEEIVNWIESEFDRLTGLERA